MEKPPTTTVEGARAIAQAAGSSVGRVIVTFNYRYSPAQQRAPAARRLRRDRDVPSVHFEWVLDRSHGADYFRRWHRDKADSGGLMVHKASHHFDLVNWWLRRVPEIVYAAGAAAVLRRGATPRPAV